MQKQASLNCTQFQERPTQVIIQKEREEQRDQLLCQQWKQARKYFFAHQLINTLSQSNATEEEQLLIKRLFVEEESYSKNKLRINFNALGNLNKYEGLIQSIQAAYNAMEQSFKRKERECAPLQQIIEHPHSCHSLQTIRIQYEPTINEWGAYSMPYSVCAFDFFKMVNENKQLMEVTLKGVQFLQFQQFILLLRKYKDNEAGELREQLSWMKEFAPSKSIKLVIDAKLQYCMENKLESNNLHGSLILFGGLFQSLSDLTVTIKLRITLIKQTAQTLSDLWKFLWAIKQIKLNILGHRQFCQASQVHSLVRTVLFGGLACFTQITSLVFQDMYFTSSDSLNDYLAMEQSLSLSFENNPITHLKIQGCLNFPSFPRVTTLKSIDLFNCSFRRKDKFTKEIVSSNKQLKFLKLQRFSSQKIGSSIFDSLQTLLLIGCSDITFENESPKSPSNIKNFSITASHINSINFRGLLPKLFSLTTLSLHGSCAHEYICAIPSPYLTKLSLAQNQLLTNRGLQKIDAKWPSLKHLAIRYCLKVTDKVWTSCKFNRLLILQVDRIKDKTILSELKSRGYRII